MTQLLTATDRIGYIYIASTLNENITSKLLRAIDKETSQIKIKQKEKRKWLSRGITVTTDCHAHAPIKLVSRFFVDGFSFAFHSDFPILILSFPQYHIKNGIEHGDI